MQMRGSEKYTGANDTYLPRSRLCILTQNVGVVICCCCEPIRTSRFCSHIYFGHRHLRHQETLLWWGIKNDRFSESQSSATKRSASKDP